jgi:hypothetical protein
MLFLNSFPSTLEFTTSPTVLLISLHMIFTKVPQSAFE